MRRYSARRIPPGTHVRQFWLLSKQEQKAKVKRLLASSLTRTAVSELTGLSLQEIAAFVDTPL